MNVQDKRLYLAGEAMAQLAVGHPPTEAMAHRLAHMIENRVGSDDKDRDWLAKLYENRNGPEMLKMSSAVARDYLSARIEADGQDLSKAGKLVLSSALGTKDANRNRIFAVLRAALNHPHSGDETEIQKIKERVMAAESKGGFDRTDATQNARLKRLETEMVESRKEQKQQGKTLDEILKKLSAAPAPKPVVEPKDDGIGVTLADVKKRAEEAAKDREEAAAEDAKEAEEK